MGYDDMAKCQALNDDSPTVSFTDFKTTFGVDKPDQDGDMFLAVTYKSMDRNIIKVEGDKATLSHTWVGDKMEPKKDADGNWIPAHGDLSIWIQLILFIPLSNIAMGFLEGTQIAILALEKAPAATVKQIHRSAYFGHKLTQQRDNVRRYLLGRQFLVVFVDFIAAHTMGLGGLGILVPVSQLYPQLLAATNPMWFMGNWGSKTILLLALAMEFCGFCHFSWMLFTIFFVVRSVMKDGNTEEQVGSVGQAVDISGGIGEDKDAPTADIDQLRDIVIEQQEKINRLEAQIGVGATDPVD